MDKARNAVNSFISKSGNHDTTVHESVAPSIQKETVKHHEKEEHQIARDREVHQDHYHTSVQPVRDTEVLPEQHHHKTHDVQHKTYDHRDHDQTREKLQVEKAQFQNESVRHPTIHKTQGTAPEVAGEHKHHHIHETVQPVVHKETIEPHVVHTTVPVHETHHNAAQHHQSSVLPTVNMSEFKSQGGHLGGRDAVTDHFKGEPKSVHKHGHGHDSTTHTSGVTGQQSGIAGQHGGITGQTTNDHTLGGGHGTTGQNVGHNNHNTHDTTHANGKTGKPSLMDKLNPKVDADGDGKAGFMK